MATLEGNSAIKVRHCLIPLGRELRKYNSIPDRSELLYGAGTEGGVRVRVTQRRDTKFMVQISPYLSSVFLCRSWLTLVQHLCTEEVALGKSHASRSIHLF